uniref:Tautomerase cis-CaaD-like domain-containing protein n=1 Tax=Mycena chlorophos TaxID=658473 RepID=A0ABQ0L351_MYCCL|nr:predicted protein [Mycena chlorophos]
MPLHRWITPKGLYTPAEKAGIANAITDLYYEQKLLKVSLPRFYVVVYFDEKEAHDFYHGGRPVTGAGGDGANFVNIHVEHLARTFSGEASKKGFMNAYKATVEPWIKGRGLDWELLVIDAGDISLWRENGEVPPAAESVEEKIWREKNRVVVGEELESCAAVMSQKV